MLFWMPGKLLGRTHKIAYNLLHKVGPKGDPGVKPGDRVSSWSCSHDMFLLFILLYVISTTILFSQSHWRMTIIKYSSATDIEEYQL